MLRYLFYVVALYLALPFSDTIDVVTIIVFFTIIEEDARFALVFAFLTGLISDLYLPIRLGINTLVYLTLSQSLLVLKKYLILNPLTTIATFIVFYLIKTAVLNVLVSSPINLTQIIYTILIFFPFTLLLKKIATGVWMKN
jgi:cell shape-determining protein MreD